MRRTQTRPCRSIGLSRPRTPSNSASALVVLGLVVAGLGINVSRPDDRAPVSSYTSAFYTLGLKRTHVKQHRIGGFAGSFRPSRVPPPRRMPSVSLRSSSPSWCFFGHPAISGPRVPEPRRLRRADSRCFLRSLTNGRPCEPSLLVCRRRGREHCVRVHLAFDAVTSESRSSRGRVAGFTARFLVSPSVENAWQGTSSRESI